MQFTRTVPVKGAGRVRRSIRAAAVVPVALLVAAATGSAAPSPDASLERIAVSGYGPAAMRAERRLRGIERVALGPEHAAEHAAQRAQTRRARRLGLRPRRPARALAEGPPERVGRWLGPRAIPAVAIHAALLPTGKLLLVQYAGAAGVGYVLDPATGEGHRVDPPANVFCAGQVFLADGRLLWVGGTLRANDARTRFWGLNQIYVFDPWTERWIRQVDMRRGRWYPTATRLPDGRVLITSGQDEVGNGEINTDVEVFTPEVPDGRLQTVGTRSFQLYPHWFVMPDGRALLAGPGRSDSAFLDLSTFAFSNNGLLMESRTGYGSGVLLPGPPAGSTRVMLVGGSSQATTEVFDATQPRAGWRSGPPLPQPRRNVNTVILPDGSLLVVGGNRTGDDGSPEYETVMLPAGGAAWTPMASQAEQRAYHSTALLLPDGRVWSGGDNNLSGGGNDGDRYELFEPPYLFRGARPEITGAPRSLDFGAAFTIAASGDPVRAVLMSPGATTHGNDMNQRHVELTVTVTPDGLRAVAPPSRNVAPPGYYMLFVLNAAGVPSAARFVTVGGSPRAGTNREPVAAITGPGAADAGAPVTFADGSRDPDGMVVARDWDLDGDGRFIDASGPRASVTPTVGGPLTVRVRATDDEGASAVAAHTVEVRGPQAPASPPVAPPPPSERSAVTRRVTVTAARVTRVGRAVRVRVEVFGASRVRVELQRCRAGRCRVITRVPITRTRLIRLPRAGRGGLRLVVVATAADGTTATRILRVP